MLESELRTMLEAANALTAEELEFVRGDSVCSMSTVPSNLTTPETRGRKSRHATKAVASTAVAAPQASPSASEAAVTIATSKAPAPALPNAAFRTPAPVVGNAANITSAPTVVSPIASPGRGAYERGRTRESKVSTVCLGAERERHEWWPLGTNLEGRINGEAFSATVVENPNIKSGCSLVITSGAAKGTVCLTPTRAAIEATEVFRQARNLGRAGGVTNGWTFWKPKPS